MATISLSMTRLFPLLKFNFSFVKLNIRSFPEIRFDTMFDYKSGPPQQLCCFGECKPQELYLNHLFLKPIPNC